MEEIKQLNVTEQYDDFYCEITELLDKQYFGEIEDENLKEFCKHYIYDGARVKDNGDIVYIMRRTGCSIGGIWTNKDNIITKIGINSDNPEYFKKDEKIQDKLNEFLGYKLYCKGIRVSKW